MVYCVRIYHKESNNAQIKTIPRHNNAHDLNVRAITRVIMGELPDKLGHRAGIRGVSNIDSRLFIADSNMDEQEHSPQC